MGIEMTFIEFLKSLFAKINETQINVNNESESGMKICIVNISKIVTKLEFDTVVKAIQKQVKQHFTPAWGEAATLKQITTKNLDKQTPELNTADVIIYVGELSDDPQSVDGALGYHDMNHAGIPYGFVFTDVAAKYGEVWSVTLSHEVLELIADPDVNLLVVGPHPVKKNAEALFSYEMCDPCQGDIYYIDNVKVSNFVLPLYFTEVKINVDTNYLKLPLTQFGVRKNGYLSYFDLDTKSWKQVFGEGAEARVQVKSSLMGKLRRSARHKGLNIA